MEFLTTIASLIFLGIIAFTQVYSLIINKHKVKDVVNEQIKIKKRLDVIEINLNKELSSFYKKFNNLMNAILKKLDD